MVESQAAFARRIGEHPSKIARWKATGRIVMSGTLVDVDASLDRIEAWSREINGEASVVETQAAFARRIGVTKSQITRWRDAGRVVMSGAMVDVEASMQRINATRGTRHDVVDRHAAERGRPLDLAVESVPDSIREEDLGDVLHGAAHRAIAPDHPDMMSLDEIGRRTRFAQMLEREAVARMREREDQELSGVLVRRATVVHAMTNAVAVILNAAESIPDRLAPLLVNIGDQNRIRALLRDETEQLLTTVSEQLGTVAGPQP